MKNWKRITIGSVSVLLGLGVLSGGAYAWWLGTPPPLPTTLDESITTLTSARYQRLTEEQKEPYLEQARRLTESLSPDERRSQWEKMRQNPEQQRAMREAQGDMMLLRAKEFAMADPIRRTQIVDQAIGMMEMGRGATTRPAREGGDRAARANNPDRPDRPEMSEEERAKQREKRMAEGKSRIQKRIEKGNPQRQAYMSEFFKAVRERRKELGLPDHPGPRGGGRGR